MDENDSPLFNNDKHLLLIAGKSGKGKAKNKPSGSPLDEAKEPSESKKSKISRTNQLFDVGSDDDDIGQETTTVINCNSKFSGIGNKKILSVLKSSELLPAETSSLCKDFEKLILYSATKQTWGKHCSAWKLFNDFCITYKISNDLPINVKVARAFVTWAIAKKNLKSSTVKSYVSSLNIAHTLSGNDNRNFNSDPCVKMIIKGAENSNDKTTHPTTIRLPMNLDLLDILGHRTSMLGWSDFSKQVFWTACVVCFFTSCRMGELLPSHKKNHDPDTTLLWKHVKILSEEDILLLVPYSKTTGFKGKVLDIYPLADYRCPLAAILRLKRLAEKKGIFHPLSPVFALSSGKNLTVETLNKSLSDILGDFCDPHHKITGHSFRAGIPSLIAAFPDKNKVSDIMEWGFWESTSYKCYTKSDREKRKILFGKIMSCIGVK